MALIFEMIDLSYLLALLVALCALVIGVAVVALRASMVRSPTADSVDVVKSNFNSKPALSITAQQMAHIAENKDAIQASGAAPISRRTSRQIKRKAVAPVRLYPNGGIRATEVRLKVQAEAAKLAAKAVEAPQVSQVASQTIAPVARVADMRPPKSIRVDETDDFYMLFTLADIYADEEEHIEHALVPNDVLAELTALNSDSALSATADELKLKTYKSTSPDARKTVRFAVEAETIPSPEWTVISAKRRLNAVLAAAESRATFPQIPAPRYEGGKEIEEDTSGKMNSIFRPTHRFARIETTIAASQAPSVSIPKSPKAESSKKVHFAESDDATTVAPQRSCASMNAPSTASNSAEFEQCSPLSALVAAVEEEMQVSSNQVSSASLSSQASSSSGSRLIDSHVERTTETIAVVADSLEVCHSQVLKDDLVIATCCSCFAMTAPSTITKHSEVELHLTLTHNIEIAEVTKLAPSNIVSSTLSSPNASSATGPTDFNSPRDRTAKLLSLVAEACNKVGLSDDEVVSTAVALYKRLKEITPSVVSNVPKAEVRDPHTPSVKVAKAVAQVSSTQVSSTVSPLTAPSKIATSLIFHHSDRTARALCVVAGAYTMRNFNKLQLNSTALAHAMHSPAAGMASLAKTLAPADLGHAAAARGDCAAQSLDASKRFDLYASQLIKSCL